MTAPANAPAPKPQPPKPLWPQPPPCQPPPPKPWPPKAPKPRAVAPVGDRPIKTTANRAITVFRNIVVTPHNRFASQHYDSRRPRWFKRLSEWLGRPPPRSARHRRAE